MISFTCALITLSIAAAVVAQTPIRENSKLSKQFQNPEARDFQPYLLRPLGGRIVLLQQLQNIPQTAFSPQPQPTTDSPKVDIQEEAKNISSAKNATLSEPEPGFDKSEKLTATEDEGVYYIYHPNGLLQKVIYSTNDDVEKMAFSARLKYENVEPIKEPIFTYDPETFVFKRL